MAERPSLRERIAAQEKAAEERIRAIQEAAGREAEDLSRRRERFDELAHHLIEVSGKPVQALAEHFDNATLTRSQDSSGYHALCYFKHTPRFPASVDFGFGLTHDMEIRKLIVGYQLQILPVFIEFERGDQVAYDMEAVREEEVKAWIEDKIVAFVEVYLRIETTEAYQRGNLVTDPVLGRRFPRVLAETESTYRGHQYFFLSDEAKRVFDEDPEQFVFG